MGARPADLVGVRRVVEPLVATGRVCTKCGVDKPFEEFSVRSDGRRLQSWCRVCTNRAVLAWQARRG